MYRALLPLLLISLTAALSAQVLPPAPVKGEIASLQPTWMGSVTGAYRQAKADKKVVVWVVMIEREVACRRMMRAVWSDPDIKAKAGSSFVLLPCNPYPKADARLFDGVSLEEVKSIEKEMRTRYETRTEIVAPQHIFTDADGKVLARKDWELDKKELVGLMNKALAKAGQPTVGPVAKAGEPAPEEEPGKAGEGKPAAAGTVSAETQRLINLIVKAPANEKEDLTDELLETAEEAGIKMFVEMLGAKKIRSEKSRVAVVRRAGYDKHSGKAKAFSALLKEKSNRVRNAAVVNLEEMKNTSVVKELLARSLGLPVEGKMSDDYREFCGLWTAEEHAEFAARQADNSRIDPVDWQP